MSTPQLPALPDSEGPAAPGSPDFRAPSSRSPATEQAYLKRALWFESHAARHLGIEEPSPLEVAAFALEKRSEWAKSTWRQMKASLVFRYSEMGTSRAMEAADMLRSATQTDCLRHTHRTSAKRAKAVSEIALQDLVNRVRRTRSKYAHLLERWLLLGAEVGLRPHEWGQSQLVFASSLEVGDVATALTQGLDPSRVLPYLRIANAKASNGRSHGQYRHLSLYRLSPEMVATVGEFAQTMATIHAAGHYAACYKACSQLLTRINVDIHRSGKAKWLQLYSPRHKFSSEAKRELSADGVAALMGHATTKTATEHYGKRVSSTGSLGPRPIAAEILRVRKKRYSKAQRIAAGATPETKPGDGNQSTAE